MNSRDCLGLKGSKDHYGYAKLEQNLINVVSQSFQKLSSVS